jgi:lactate dehydrogenase-like 2-hydroxyacid dehydrogenase
MSFPVRKIGFLGFGRIAQATLARLIPFGVTHCLYTSNPNSRPQVDRDAAISRKYDLKLVKRVDLHDLAKESDLLFVLAPGGEATKHLVDEEFLKKMKKTSIIVNTSRGTVVDSDALAKALREGWIWGAGLDVVEGEPNVSIDHPLLKEPRFVEGKLYLPEAVLLTQGQMCDYATCWKCNLGNTTGHGDIGCKKCHSRYSGRLDACISELVYMTCIKCTRRLQSIFENQNFAMTNLSA